MSKVDFSPEQIKAVQELRNGSILAGGVGTGKSRVAIQYYLRSEAPKKLYIITTAKKRDSLDWVAEANHQRIGSGATDSAAGEISDILTVDSWNNLGRYVDVRGAFFILDEQRLVGSGAWVKAFYKIAKNNNWILLSATPGDTWMDYIPVFVANGYYRNRFHFQQEHVVYNRYSKYPKVDRFMHEDRLKKLRAQLLVEMHYEKHTIRHIHDVEVDYDETLFQKVVKDRWHVYENRPLKDVAELFSVMRKVVNSDGSRMDALSSLLQTHPRIIVFYNFDYELELLREYLSNTRGAQQKMTKNSTLHGLSKNEKDDGKPHDSCVGFHETDLTTQTCSVPDVGISIAEWNGHKHQEIPKTERWVYLVQYQAGAEGWNCIETNVCIFFSLNYSYRIFEQCMGRIDRRNTPFLNLHYYVFKSGSAIDRMITKALDKKQNFNERKYIKRYKTSVDKNDSERG